jgi:hypothetical protein
MVQRRRPGIDIGVSCRVRGGVRGRESEFIGPCLTTSPRCGGLSDLRTTLRTSLARRSSAFAAQTEGMNQGPRKCTGRGVWLVMCPADVIRIGP